MRLDKNVVLKADRRPLSQDTMSSLKREAETLKNLSHSYIPQIYDFVIEDGVVYTVMDYIEGESLNKALESGGRFNSQQIVLWAKQVLEALVYLHSRPPYGILHSDIKPANIMLTPQGDIRLIDFNIALALGEDGAVSVGRSLGYASPEHYGMNHKSGDGQEKQKTSTISEADTVDSSEGHNPIVLDARSDIYGLGATLYHLITCCRPASNAIDVTPLTTLDCPYSLAYIINKAMSPNRDSRFQTAAEMLAAFVNIHRNDPRSRRLRRLRTATVFTLAVILAAGAFATFTGLKRLEAGRKLDTFVGASQNSLMKDDKTDAIKMALDAVSTNVDLFTPPVTADAKKALADALGIYDLSEGFKLFRELSLPSAPLMIDLSPNGDTTAIVCAYELMVFNTATGKTLAKLPVARSALSEAVFIDDNTLAYAGESGISLYSIKDNRVLWTGEPVTSIALSADGGTIAGVFRDQSHAVIYDTYGNMKVSVSFGDRCQLITPNDGFANPKGNLFALNADGSLLAASFADGSLSIFDLQDGGRDLAIIDKSGYLHFEGGFSGDYFAFSATSKVRSLFSAIDIAVMENTAEFEKPNKIGVHASETGIFISLENLLVGVDLDTGAQWEIAYTDKYIQAYDCDGYRAIVSTEDNKYVFFDKTIQLSQYRGEYTFDFVLIAGEFAIVGNRNLPDVRVLRYENRTDAQVFAYDPALAHSEARINAEGTRVMLFNYNCARLYDICGSLIKEISIPDAEWVRDQQYSKASGNLAVVYEEALRIYSGVSGALLLEKTDLASTFCAPYGISILEKNGDLSLVDMDTADIKYSSTVSGDFAAYCGIVVDDSFLNGQKLLGAARIGNSYLFAQGDGSTGAIYNGKGQKLFDVDTPGKCETFFTADAVVISPLHGTPVVYNCATGRKIRELEQNAYLTCISQMNGYVVSEYITTEGERFGLLLDDQNFESLAYLPWLTDIDGDDLIFDIKTGYLRRSCIYTADELILMAQNEF